MVEAYSLRDTNIGCNQENQSLKHYRVVSTKNSLIDWLILWPLQESFTYDPTTMEEMNKEKLGSFKSLIIPNDDQNLWDQ